MLTIKFIVVCGKVAECNIYKHEYFMHIDIFHQNSTTKILRKTILVLI